MSHLIFPFHADNGDLQIINLENVAFVTLLTDSPENGGSGDKMITVQTHGGPCRGFQKDNKSLCDAVNLILENGIPETFFEDYGIDDEYDAYEPPESCESS